MPADTDPYWTTELPEGWELRPHHHLVAKLPPTDKRPPASRVAQKVDGEHLKPLPSHQRVRLHDVERLGIVIPKGEEGE